MTPTCRLLVVDDHPLMREAVVIALGDMKGIQLEKAASLAGAIRALENDPSIRLVILDLHLQDASGRETILGLRERFPEVPVLIYSADASVKNITMAFENHVRGFVGKTSEGKVLRAAILLVLSGGTYIPPETAGILGIAVTEDKAAPRDHEQLDLTGRQKQVFQLLLQGMPNKVIASRLDMAEGTVKTHLNVVYRLLGVNTRVEAILKARARGLLP